MTLTQTAILTKNAINIFAILFVISIIGFIGYKIWYNNYLASLPPVEEKPDTKFGILPPPNFPKASVSSSNYTYTLDTKTGGLPKLGQDLGFEKLVKVYFVNKLLATFLSSERSQGLAEKFGINNPPEILTETKYKFKEQNKQLMVDLDTGNFIYTKEATAAAKPTSFDSDKLVRDFRATLSDLGVLKEGLRNGPSKVILLKYLNGKFIPTDSKDEAIAFQISLWPEDLDNKIIYTPDFKKSLVSSIVLNSAENMENYIALNFTFWPIDTTTFATYPTKLAEVAFEDLKSGKGVVVIEGEKGAVSITSVSLGYFLSEIYNPYIQPIYIFEGPNFVAYVPALPDQFISPTK